MLVKCLDADEEKYPPTTGSALARTALASVWVSETQSLSHTRITSQIFVQITTISNHRNPAESGRLER